MLHVCNSVMQRIKNKRFIKVLNKKLFTLMFWIPRRMSCTLGRLGLIPCLVSNIKILCLWLITIYIKTAVVQRKTLHMLKLYCTNLNEMLFFSKLNSHERRFLFLYISFFIFLSSYFLYIYSRSEKKVNVLINRKYLINLPISEIASLYV